jgi:hypothetical protein
MSINLATRYPGRTNPADSNYPQGSFKNRSAPGVLDGSYLEKDWANDMIAFFQRALVEAGIEPDGDVDNATNSQYYEAIKAKFAAKADFLSVSATTFAAGVIDGNAVYWDAANTRFDKAIADGTNKQNMIGFADVTNSRVILMGAYSGQLSGLTLGAKYYLSATVAGAITATVPTNNGVTVGIAKSATVLFADIDASGSGTVTAASDPTFADNSSSAASTSWVRGAMSAIAVAAGFAISLTANGYIKLPTWLGGLIFQWGLSATLVDDGEITVTFPIAFPTACLNVTATLNQTTYITGGFIVYIDTITASSFLLGTDDAGTSTITNQKAYWYAIGH